jgi:hypothetical protein
MAKQNKLEKDAKKAYKKAVVAIDDAARLAKKAGKKSRAKVETLAKQVENLAAPAKRNAPAKAAPAKPKTKATAKPLADYTPPLPHAHTVPAKTASGSIEQVELGTMSIIALRNLAKSKGMTGYTRLNKASLIQRLEEQAAL